jgi:SAM-dependent MidA family methyltransferase
MRKERKQVNIALLKTPEKNTRIHPEKQINEIRRSLKKWGQYKDIVIDDQHLILAGNGLVEAMRAEGYTKASVVVLYELSENDKKKLMMSDNKTAGLGIDNLTNIDAIISELNGDFDIPGFDDEVLASINASSEEISIALNDYGKATEANIENIDANSDVNDIAAEFVEPEGSNVPTEEKKSVKCPRCGADVWL